MPVAELHANGENPVAEALPNQRVRLVAVTLQLQVVVDDGTVLEPLQVQPITITAREWENFDLGAQVGDLQRQLNEAVG